MVSESQKRASKNYAKRNSYEAQKKYSHDNIRKVTVSLSPELKEDFKKVCDAQNLKMNAVLKKFIEDFVEKNSGKLG